MFGFAANHCDLNCQKNDEMRFGWKMFHAGKIFTITVTNFHHWNKDDCIFCFGKQHMQEDYSNEWNSYEWNILKRLFLEISQNHWKKINRSIRIFSLTLIVYKKTYNIEFSVAQNDESVKWFDIFEKKNSFS